MLACSLLPPNIEHTDSNILAAMQKLKYPVLSTLKMDGIRAIKLNDLVSRTLKLIPNRSIRARAMKLPPGFDMDLWNPYMQYDCIESVVMSREHELSDSIQFHILDTVNDMEYQQRITTVDRHLAIMQSNGDTDDIGFRRPTLCFHAEGLLTFFLECERDNGEGCCFRLPNSPYKQNRSTLKEQYLIKLARYIRQEVTIIGFYEQMENGNPERRNAVGKMDRSKSLGDMMGKNTLGGFHVRDIKGREFNVGTGVNLTDNRRHLIWSNRDKWIDTQITVKHKPHGEKIKPRSPIAILDAEYVGPRKKGF